MVTHFQCEVSYSVAVEAFFTVFHLAELTISTCLVIKHEWNQTAFAHVGVAHSESGRGQL